MRVEVVASNGEKGLMRKKKKNLIQEKECCGGGVFRFVLGRYVLLIKVATLLVLTRISD